MILVADEGVDSMVVERLRRDGHDVVHVAESSPSIPDEEVLQQANIRRAVLMTADKDFGELVFRQGLVHSGVMPLRLAGLPDATKAAIVAAVCRDRRTERGPRGIRLPEHPGVSLDPRPAPLLHPFPLGR